VIEYDRQTAMTMAIGAFNHADARGSHTDLANTRPPDTTNKSGAGARRHHNAPWRASHEGKSSPDAPDGTQPVTTSTMTFPHSGVRNTVQVSVHAPRRPGAKRL